VLLVTNEIKVGTPIEIVLLMPSDVRGQANGLLIVCFNALPQ